MKLFFYLAPFPKTPDTVGLQSSEESPRLSDTPEGQSCIRAIQLYETVNCDKDKH